jgi:hypothetical protein
VMSITEYQHGGEWTLDYRKKSKTTNTGLDWFHQGSMPWFKMEIASRCKRERAAARGSRMRNTPRLAQRPWSVPRKFMSGAK